MSWTLIVFTALMAAWAIGGAATADNHSKCLNDQVLGQQTCETARDAGTAIGVALIFFLWFVGFVVLGLIWLMTRPKRRLCPACGTEAKRGVTVCSGCSFDFARAAAGAAPDPHPVPQTR
jgi:hypothetical protein